MLLCTSFHKWMFWIFTASLPGTETAHQLVMAIRQKCTPEEAINVLKDLQNPEEMDGDMTDTQFNPLKIDVFVQTLLNLGSKSFSHSFAAISKFHYVFKVRVKLTVACNVKCVNGGRCLTQFCFCCSVWLKQRKHKFVFFTMCLSYGTPINRCCACWLTNCWKHKSSNVRPLQHGYFPKKWTANSPKCICGKFFIWQSRKWTSTSLN